MQQYYQRLGLTEQASIDEIKKAYRKLAVQYHPDRNNQPNAEEQFRLIAEAYQTLVAYREGSYLYTAFTFDNTSEEMARKAREREEAIRQQEEAFRAYMQTDEFKFWFYIEMLGQLVLFGILFAFIGGFLFGLLFLGGFLWGLFGLIPVGIAVYFVQNVIASSSHSWRDYKNALLFFININYFIVFLLIVFNTVVFFKIGMNTFIRSDVFIAFTFASFLFFVYWVRKHSFSKPKEWMKGAIPTLALNLLLFFNFVFAMPSQTYFYKWEPHLDGGRKSTQFDLESNAYRAEWHSRTLWDFSVMEERIPVSAQYINQSEHGLRSSYFVNGDQVIELEIAKGLFGLPILKSYSFLDVNSD